MQRHDILIAGASFAGLTTAFHLARAGKDVMVLEQKRDVGSFLHTSGILTQDALSCWDFPRPLLHPISKVRLYNRRLRHTTIESDDYFFHANDTGALLRWMAGEVAKAGGGIALDTKVKNVTMGDDSVLVATTRGDFTGSILLGADGAQSTVAEHAGLSANTKFLVGVEHEYADLGLPRDMMHAFIDPILAPGYIAWIMPGVKFWQAGLAGHRGLKCDMAAFMEKTGRHLGFAASEPVERRAGIIPINGRLKNIVKHRVLLLGDAAGLVSPLTAGGIHYGMQAARQTAECLKDKDSAGYPDALKQAATAFPLFRLKHTARALYDWTPAQTILDSLVGSGMLDRIARNVFFHQ